MGIELRPLGVNCNISCKYCYQHSQREYESNIRSYDISKMKESLEKAGGSFILFGGEPLLMPFNDLETILRWGYERYKKNSIQTNGILITDRHIELFKRFNVDVGISIDGPGELNDVRWCKSLERTRENTKKVEKIIERLCTENLAPGLIVTLHKCNAVKKKLPIMHDWVQAIDKIGVKSIRLHLLEVDNPEIRDSYALSTWENIEALLSFIELEKGLNKVKFDITREIKALLMGKDENVSCVWRACDPCNTQSVHGIEGDGRQSKCSRVNKDGADYLRTDKYSYIRYVALYNTSQSEGGCKGCRFFLMCKGYCPGTAIDGDWRNRTEHCEVWKYMFSFMEKEIVLEGATPLSLHPVRKRLENNMLEAWKNGSNPPLAVLSWMQKDRPSENRSAVFFLPMWFDNNLKEIWNLRINKIKLMLTRLSQNYSKPIEISLTRDSCMFLSSIGIEFDSVKISEKNFLDNLNAKATKDGYYEEIKWFAEILAWPLEVSTKNGLCKIETPIIKLVASMHT